MRKILGAIGLVALGYLMAIYFQFTLNVSYQHVYQTPNAANQRQLTLSLQPYHEMKPINLFGSP